MSVIEKYIIILKKFIRSLVTCNKIYEINCILLQRLFLLDEFCKLNVLVLFDETKILKAININIISSKIKYKRNK